jgi:riboflavin kinase/FMN adenylyltransferase
MNVYRVHCGHQWVIQRVMDRARTLGVSSMAITFDPHPVRVLRPGDPRQLITPLESKLHLLRATGLDAILVLPFDEVLAKMSATAFASDILERALHVVELHEGENFRFGYQAEAGVDVLEALGAKFGFTVVRYQPRTMLGAPISSSRIRSMIDAGDINSARKLLGRPFAITSTPTSGRGFGSRYTVPTINLAPYTELLPAHGVYVTTLAIGDGGDRQIFGGVTNIGNRPTFGVDSFAVESHLFDFHPIALTEQTRLELTFLHRLRAEKKWENPDALREQIGRDVEQAQRYLRLRRQMASHRVSAAPLA